MKYLRNAEDKRGMCWCGCGEKGTLAHCWWECKLAPPLQRADRRVLLLLSCFSRSDQQSRSWVDIQRKCFQVIRETHAPQRSQLPCSQQPRHGDNLRVHWWVNAQRKSNGTQTHTHTHTHTHTRRLFSHKQKGILPSATTGMILKGDRLSEINQTQIMYDMTYRWNLKTPNSETES